jgi:outer membrane biosynthesis protein TonB
MPEKDLTKKVLIKVAKDLSQIFEQPIETDGKTNMDLLKKDLIEAGNELQEGDSIADESKDVLIALGVKLPWPVEPEIEVEKGPVKPVKQKEATKKAKAKPAGKKKAADKKGKEKPASEKKAVDKKAEKVKPVEKDTKVKTKKYTRVQAFCDALYGNPKTIEEMAQQAKDLYDKANPGREKSKLSYIQWTIEKYYIVPFVIFGFVVLKDEKYSLKD